MILGSLSVAATSLKAQQKAMDVVSHNIANVNTKGYSRQVANIASLTSEKIGGLSLGRGVEVNSVRRIVDTIINKAEITNGSKLAFWNAQQSGLNAVENVFGSLQSTGLASALDKFFLSWKQLANNPQDTGIKSNVRAKSSSLVNSLSNMRSQLSTVQANTNSNIDQAIIRANQVLDKIASLSVQINRQEVGGKGITGQANDLRDQRDQALRDLSKIIPVQQVSTLDGSFMIQTINGDLLAQDNIARHLARGSAITGSFADIVIAGTGSPITSLAQGGEIGGMIELRDNKLGNYINQIDSLAANLIFSVNQLHANGAPASHLSSISAEQGSNATLAIDNANQTAPFAAQIKTGSFNVHVYDNTGAATPAGGTSITITAGTSTMTTIAASINAIAGVTAAVDSNGKLSITAAAGQTFTLSDDTSNMLAAYEINTFFQGNNANSIALSNRVQNDANAINTGKVTPASSYIAVADNSIALSITALQNTLISVDGSTAASLHDRTTSLSTRFGTDSGIAKQQQDFRTVEAESLQNQRQVISGVNIDEELISMITFQRAYQASAKVITTSNQMLDSLLGLIR